MNAPEEKAGLPLEPPPPPTGDRADARAAVAVGGVFLFTPAALALADRDLTVFGVPAVAAYVFAAWFLGIVLTARLAR